MSNLFQKKLVAQNENPLFIILVVFVLLSIVSLPLFVRIFFSGFPAEYFFYMILCAIFAVSSNSLLVKALGYSDLSLLGPINSYKPVVGMIFGIIMLSEVPNPAGLLGIVLIISGSYFIVDKNIDRSRNGFVNSFLKDKGIQLRIAALILSGIEAAFLKKALAYSTPLITLAVWSITGFAVSGIASLLLINFNAGPVFKEAWNKKKTYFFLFVSTAAMQLTTLFVFEYMQVGYALALFQTSALVSVVLGYKYFKEKNIRNRMIGSLLMVSGSVMIIIFGK